MTMKTPMKFLVAVVLLCFAFASARAEHPMFSKKGAEITEIAFTKSDAGAPQLAWVKTAETEDYEAATIKVLTAGDAGDLYANGKKVTEAQLAEWAKTHVNKRVRLTGDEDAIYFTGEEQKTAPPVAAPTSGCPGGNCPRRR